ncbi:hypothetical protein FBZ93_106309 [Bradyrhizobium macuxiense]|uniref:Uncharacterized protein n=1 Tax=Bradyrhizobium macuxiense TaxID=1755647 RepID=A0A560LYE1_9BRAD|nr:hypothetical protein FBZ93_106309 [Bradyrhizobium macuxiense]
MKATAPSARCCKIIRSPDAVVYHKSAAALSGFSKTGLTDIKDMSEGWWMTGQTILVNGRYTTK